jgi:hypothetical protein
MIWIIFIDKWCSNRQSIWGESFSQVIINSLINSVRREVLYNILIEFGVPTKLVMLIKMCLNKIYSKMRVGEDLSDNFPI